MSGPRPRRFILCPGLLLWLALGGQVLAQAAQPPPPTTAAAGALGPRPGEVASVQAALRAMQQADLPALVQLYQTSSEPVAHIWAAMALERVHFNLEAASADARLCQQALFDSRPAIALACGQFESGDLRLAGLPHAAEEKERELIHRFQGLGLDKPLAGMQAYMEQQGHLPALLIERPQADVTLPLDDSQTSPSFTATANGHLFHLTLDTGATDLVLGEQDARRLGIKLLEQSGQTSGWLSKNIPTRRGLLDELQMGSITLHNVPVTIVPSRVALVGINLMAPLGSLRISRSALVIYGSHAVLPACTTDLLVGSELWGRGLRIVPRLLINDLPQSVMLDTGAEQYLMGTKMALSEVTLLHRGKYGIRDIGGSHPFADVQSAKVRLAISGQPIDMRFLVYTDSTTSHPITLGAGALRDMDFFIDFAHQHMCFLLHPGLH